MSTEVKGLAFEIYDRRQEKVKRLETGETKKLIVESYVTKILQIFKLSDEEEKSSILIWQVKLCKYYDNKTSFKISFEKGEDAEFYDSEIFKSSNCYTKKMMGQSKVLNNYINDLYIPSDNLNDIYEYFNENLLEYFIITKTDDDNIIIELKDQTKL